MISEASNVMIVGRISTWRERLSINGRQRFIGAWLSHPDYGKLGVYLTDDALAALPSLPNRASIQVHGFIHPQLLTALDGDHRIVADGPHPTTVMVIAAHAIEPWNEPAAPTSWPTMTITVHDTRRVHPFWVGTTDMAGMAALLATPCAETPSLRAVQGLCGILATAGHQTYLRMLWIDAQLAADWTMGRHQRVSTVNQSAHKGNGT